MVKVVSAGEANDLIKNEEVLIDLYAEWCGPCKMIGPILDKVEAETDVKIVKVDVDKDQAFAQSLEVQGVPTLIKFKGGKEVARHVGFAPEPKLKELINS